MADSTRLPTYKMYTIGWIAALDKELTAALAILDETHQQPEDFEQNDKDSNAYSWGQIGGHNIVIASLSSGSYGLVSAATTATCMATSLPHLRFGLMVGIGAGVPSLVEHDIRLGDVVASLPSGGNSGVIQYDLGKMGENGQFRRVGALSSPPEVLLKALTKLRAEQRLKDSNIPQILSKAIRDHPKLERSKGKDSAFVYQGAENDRLFEATSVHVSGKSSSQTLAGGAKRRKISDTQSCLHCDAEREIEREERPTTDPEVHYGTMASGNLVIKDGVFRDQVLERLGTDVLCYEMEAAGLMNNFPCLVIRGICDYADTHKNDRWQNYAALAAAAYAKELLGTIDARRVVLADKMQKIMTEVSDTKQAVQSLNDEQLLNKIYAWLSAPDPSRDQNTALQQHHVATGQWLLKGKTYQRWKTASASCIWLYGIPGCGKTVLSSAIISDLENCDTPDQHIIYFYFTFTDVAKQSLDGAIRSLINQLCSKSAAAREHLTAAFTSEHRDGSKQPSTRWLCETFEIMIKVSGRVWIVLDALDECQLWQTFPNEGLLTWLRSLLDHKHDNLHIIVTSRHEIRIQKTLDQCVQICLQSREVDSDIRTFVNAAVSTWTASGVWQEHQKVEQEIKHHLTTNAHGMFRWVSCQLDALEPLAGSKNHVVLLDTLRSLPKTLDDTYARILQNIPERLQKGAQRVLQFLIHSEEPLKVDEAVEITLLSPEAERHMRRVNTLIKPDLQEVLLYCPNLVKTAKISLGLPSDDKVEVLQLAHFSVKEYLLSERSDRQTFWTSKKGLAKASMADICLAYLLEIPRDWPIPDVMSSYPLAQHAATFWTHYAHQADNEMSKGLIKELVMDTDSQATYANLHRHSYYSLTNVLRKPKWTRNNSNFSPDRPDTLHYHFVSHGVLCAVRIILETGKKDINTWGMVYNNALQDAAFEGHSDIVEELIRRGAYVDAVSRHHNSALATASRYQSCALATAVEKSHEETVDILLRYNADTNIDQDILHRAIFRGNIKIINMLLTHGANVSQRAFCLACENSKTAISSMLLKHIRGNNVVSYCNYAFPRTCETGQYSTVQTLMRNNADIDTKDSNNLTGLYHAASRGYSDIVELLLKTGAQLIQGDDFEKSPLYAAVKNGHIDIMRLLLARDTHAKFFDETFTLALSCSTSCSRTAAVALLLETFKAKHQIDTKRAILTEDLYAAISKSEEGYDRIVALLLDNGVDANAGIGSKESILSWTFGLSIRAKDKKAALNVVASLVDHGADPNEVHGIHGTLLETAVRIQEWGVAKILAERGAKKPPHYDLLQLMSSKRYQLQQEQHTTTTRHHVVTDYQTEMETADSV